MRLILPFAALIVAAISIFPDVSPAPLASGFCAAGFCRFDQLFTRIDAKGVNLATVGDLLNRDPLNPYIWCVYAELLSTGGKPEAAAAAFDRAVSLGPGMSPVLMRAANFDFGHGRIDHGNLLASRILSQTDAFDQILFSYLTRFSAPVSRLLGSVIPAQTRPARAWLAWLKGHGADEDLLQAWSWMQQTHLADQKTAVDLTWTLWRRKAFSSAQQIWVNWLGAAGKDYLHPQQLWNTRFGNEPNGSPFDWTLTSPASVRLSRGDGLEIRFAGSENVAFSSVSQFAVVSLGHYRFSAEIAADGLTTDERPFFHIFDPMNPGRLDVRMQPPNESAPRSWITVDFSAPPGTQTLQVQIERRPSQRFDNKIAGAMHVYQVSLVPLS